MKQDAHTTEFEDLPTTVLRLQRENGRLRGQLGQGESGVETWNLKQCTGHPAPSSSAACKDMFVFETRLLSLSITISFHFELTRSIGESESGGANSGKNPQTWKRLVQKLSILDTEADIKQCIEDEVTTLEFAKQCLLFFVLQQQQVRRGGEQKPTGPDVYDWFPASEAQAPSNRDTRSSMEDTRASAFAPAPAPAPSPFVAKTPATSPQRYASTPLYSRWETDGARQHPQTSSVLRSDWSASGRPASATTNFEFGRDAQHHHHRSLYEATSPIRGATAAYNASILLNMRNQKRSHQRDDARQPSDGMYEPARQAQAHHYRSSPPRLDTWKGGSALHQKSPLQVKAGESRPETDDVLEPEQSSSLAAAGMSTSEVLRAGQVYEMREENGARPATMIWCSQDLRSLLWRRVAEETVCGALPISEVSASKCVSRFTSIDFFSQIIHTNTHQHRGALTVRVYMY